MWLWIGYGCTDLINKCVFFCFCFFSNPLAAFLPAERSAEPGWPEPICSMGLCSLKSNSYYRTIVVLQSFSHRLFKGRLWCLQCSFTIHSLLCHQSGLMPVRKARSLAVSLIWITKMTAAINSYQVNHQHISWKAIRHSGEGFFFNMLWLWCCYVTLLWQ